MRESQLQTFPQSYFATSRGAKKVSKLMLFYTHKVWVILVSSKMRAANLVKKEQQALEAIICGYNSKPDFNFCTRHYVTRLGCFYITAILSSGWGWGLVENVTDLACGWSEVELGLTLTLRLRLKSSWSLVEVELSWVWVELSWN